MSETSFETICKEVACNLNCRPITKLSTDINDEHALTPSHLLFGHRINNLPYLEANKDDSTDPTYNDSSVIKNLMEQRSIIHEKFLDRFKNEYASVLRERHSFAKNKEPATSEPKVGEVVMVFNDLKPRKMWKLGIIQELLTGPDGKTRAANVKTENRVINRAISHLYPIEVSEAKSEVIVPEISVPVVSSRPRRSAFISAVKKISDQSHPAEDVEYI